MPACNSQHFQHLLSCKKFFASFFTTASQLKLQQARNDDVESGEESVDTFVFVDVKFLSEIKDKCTGIYRRHLSADCSYGTFCRTSKY